MPISCTSCGQPTKVTDSREAAERRVIRRTRVCRCGHRFSTYEITADAYAAILAASKQVSAVVEKIRGIEKFEFPDMPEDMGLAPNRNRK